MVESLDDILNGLTGNYREFLNEKEDIPDIDSWRKKIIDTEEREEKLEQTLNKNQSTTSISDNSDPDSGDEKGDGSAFLEITRIKFTPPPNTNIAINMATNITEQTIAIEKIKNALKDFTTINKTPDNIKEENWNRVVNDLVVYSDGAGILFNFPSIDSGVAGDTRTDDAKISQFVKKLIEENSIIVLITAEGKALEEFLSNEPQKGRVFFLGDDNSTLQLETKDDFTKRSQGKIDQNYSFNTQFLNNLNPNIRKQLDTTLSLNTSPPISSTAVPSALYNFNEVKEIWDIAYAYATNFIDFEHATLRQRELIIFLTGVDYQRVNPNKNVYIGNFGEHLVVWKNQNFRGLDLPEETPGEVARARCYLYAVNNKPYYNKVLERGFGPDFKEEDIFPKDLETVLTRLRRNLGKDIKVEHEIAAFMMYWMLVLFFKLDYPTNTFTSQLTATTLGEKPQ